MLHSALPLMNALRLLPIVLIVCLLGCKGGAPAAASDPKAVALQLLQTFHKEDWQALGGQIAFSPAHKGENLSSFGANFKKGLDSTPNIELVHQLFASMADMKAGEPTITGDKASVPITCTYTVQGKSKVFGGYANLAKDDGVWKWDFTGSDNIEAETMKRMPELMGQPK